MQCDVRYRSFFGANVERDVKKIFEAATVLRNSYLNSGAQGQVSNTIVVQVAPYLTKISILCPTVRDFVLITSPAASLIFSIQRMSKKRTAAESGRDRDDVILETAVKVQQLNLGPLLVRVKASLGVSASKALQVVEEYRRFLELRLLTQDHADSPKGIWLVNSILI